MLDIKKRLILVSLLCLSTSLSFAQEGCIDNNLFTKIESGKVETSKSTLIIRLTLSDKDITHVTYKHHKGSLKVRIYGSYITQDSIKLSDRVILLEYEGFTLLDVIGGKRLLYQKNVDNKLVLAIET
jgi:hypothetical protein